MRINDEYEAFFPSQKELEEASALLFVVYKINPKEVGEMTWRAISIKVVEAENKITWIQLYKFRRLLEPKTLWMKILSKIKH